MKVEIRSLQDQDRRLIQMLLSHIPSFDAEDQAIALELVNFAIDQPDQKDYSFFMAINREDQLVGYACFGPTPLTRGTYDLYWIAVDPAWSSKKIGTRLLKAVEECIRSNQARMLLIETSSGQNYERTRRFYVKNGYELVETIPDFYRPGEDRMTYVKRFS
jgi:ribosomal protein S18 acetylase RimI-like enzyme